MQIPLLSTIAKNKISWSIFVILTGIACGIIIILFFSRLPATYATFCLVAIITPFIAIMYGDSKRLLLLALMICLPITVDITINHTGHKSGAAGYVISIYDIVLAFLYLLWFTELISKKLKNIKFYPEFSLPAISLIGFACLSMIPAKNPSLSVYEVIEVTKMYLTFFYLANNIKTKKDVNFIITIFIACLLFEGMLGWAQHRYDRPFFPTALGGPQWIDSRVSGTWASYNDFGWYITFFLPLGMSMTFSEIKPSYKLICFIAVAAGSGALMWTNSRSSWISFGIAIIFVGLAVLKKIKDKRSLMNTILAIMFIVIIIFPLYPRLFNKMYGRFAGSDGGSADSRMPQFEMAADIIQDHPILGVGINNYTLIMWDYDKTEEGLGALTHHQVHNIFLQIAAEMGIPGLAMFLWLVASILFAGLRYVMLNEDITVFAVIGLLGGLLAFLVHGLYDAESIGGKLFLFIWVFAAIIFAIRKIDQEEKARFHQYQ